MNKLKYIRVQEQDNSYSADIPIGADAQNIDMKNNNTLQDTIGNLDVSTDDNITEQLASLHQGINSLDSDKLNKSDVNNYVPSVVTNWLNTNVNPVGSAVTIDKSLSIEDSAADSKITGDIIKINSEALYTYTGMLHLTWTKGGLYAATGLDYLNPNEKTGHIAVYSNQPYMIINPNGKTYAIFEYENNGESTEKIVRTASSDKYKVIITQSNTKYIRIQIECNPSSIDAVTGFTIIEMSAGYIQKSMGNIASGVYSKLADLPLGTVVSINTAVINAMEDTPVPNATSGANVITLAGSNSNRGGSIQLVAYWTGSLYYRGYNSQYQPWEEILIRGKEKGRYIIPIGYFTNTNIYSSLSDLPQNSMAAFDRITANAMTDCPYINETGIFVETISPNNDSENGGIQRVTSWNGNFEAIRSYVSNTWRNWIITEHNRETIYTVGAAGTGKDFTSLVQCLQVLNNKTASKTKKYTVFIDAGTYNISGIADLITAGTVNQAGCILPPNTEIIGKGKDKTIVTFEYAGSNDTVMSQASLFNIPYCGKLKGMSIIVKNIRYAIHTDTDVNNLGSEYMYNNTIEFEDLYCEHKGFDSNRTPSYKAPAAFGMGIWSGQKRFFKNCDFVANEYCGWLVHNRQDFSESALLDFENCSFISSQTQVPQFNSERSSASFISWGAPTKTTINMRDCFSNRPISLHPNASAPTGIYCDYYGYFNNDIFIMESNNENAHKQDNYITGSCIKRLVTDSNITAYSPVEYNGINNCTSTFSGLSGRGIALHDAAVGKICIIQTKGMIYSPWINLHASAVGKSYNWNGSNWVETSEDHPFIKVIQERVAIINP